MYVIEADGAVKTAASQSARAQSVPSKTGRADRQVELRPQSEDMALADRANERFVHIGVDQTANM